jgi:hypothetical protein
LSVYFTESLIGNDVSTFHRDESVLCCAYRLAAIVIARSQIAWCHIFYRGNRLSFCGLSAG